MGLVEKVRKARNLRDIVHKMPDAREELGDYITSNYGHIKDFVEKNPQYKDKLSEMVNKTFDKYSKHIGGWNEKLSGLGHGIGYIADTWLLSTGDIVGSLGGKFLNLLAQVPDKAYGLVYGVKTGDYLGAAENVLRGIISYVPGLTFVDTGLTRIVQKRMVKDAVTNFEKEVGIYKSWTTRLAEKLSGAYTGVKDRIKNVFRPDYKPEPVLQPA